MKNLYIYFSLLVFGCIVAAAWAQWSNLFLYPYLNDSIIYLQQAKNLLVGNGLVLNATGLSPDDLIRDLEPISYFPPGFPILIAAISSGGLDPADVILWIPLAAWIFLPAVEFWSLRPVLGTPLAVVAAILIATSPGVITWGSKGMADVPSLFLVMLAFGTLIRSFKTDLSNHYLILSGLLLGINYALRYAGLAALLSVIGAFCLAVLLRLLAPREAAYKVTLLMLGCVPVLILVWGRNLILFGQVQSYVAPSPVSLKAFIDNSRDYLRDLLLDFTGVHNIAQLAWDSKLLLLFAAPITVGVLYGLFKHWKQSGLAERFSTLLFALYLITASAMIVLANTRYHAVDFGIRYVIQATWGVIVLTGFAIGGSRFKFKRVVILAGVPASVLILGHVMFAIEKVQHEAVIQRLLAEHKDMASAVRHLPQQEWIVTEQLWRYISQDEELINAVRELPDDAFIVSNEKYLLEFLTGRKIRLLGLHHIYEARGAGEKFRNAVAQVGLMRPAYWLILPTNGMLKSPEANIWQRAILDQLPKDLTVVKRAQTMLLLKF